MRHEFLIGGPEPSVVVMADWTPAWAERVLGTPDVDGLWDLVAETTRLDLPDPLAAWREHGARLAARSAALNALELDAVRFRGPGTELEVGLIPGGRWGAAGTTTALGCGARHLPKLRSAASTACTASTSPTMTAVSSLGANRC